MRLVKLLLGVIVFALAVLASAGVLSTFVAPRTALGISLAGLVLVSLACTLALRRSLSRIDPRTSVLGDFVGLSGVCALVVLALVLAFGRRPLSAAIERSAGASDGWPPATRSVLCALATWLAPTEERAVRPPDVLPVASDAGSSAAPREVDAALTADAASADDATSAPVRDAGAAVERHLFADIQPCDYAFLLYAGDFDGDKKDELVVWCLASVHVLHVTEDKIVETFRFVPAPPPGLVRQAGTPSVVDVDGDGKRDLLLCTTWTTPQGGTRGGASYLARGDGAGHFDELVPIGQAPCNAIGLSDVTGDGVADLVTLHTGNPWQKERPNGAIAWATGKGTRWTERGALATDVFPRAMAFGDYDGDGIGDVLVWHDWDSQDHARRVYRGTKKGLVAAPADAGAPPPEVDRSRVTVDLDGDGVPDEVVLEPQAHVSVYRSAHPGEPVLRDVTVAPPR